MKRLALTAMFICLCLVPLGAHVADRRLEKAVERIEKNDTDGLRRLLHVATTGKAPLGVVSVLVRSRDSIIEPLRGR